MPNGMYKYQMPTEKLKAELAKANAELLNAHEAWLEKYTELKVERDRYRDWYDEACERIAELLRERSE